MVGANVAGGGAVRGGTVGVAGAAGWHPKATATTTHANAARRNNENRRNEAGRVE